METYLTPENIIEMLKRHIEANFTMGDKKVKATFSHWDDYLKGTGIFYNIEEEVKK